MPTAIKTPPRRRRYRAAARRQNIRKSGSIISPTVWGVLAGCVLLGLIFAGGISSSQGGAKPPGEKAETTRPEKPRAQAKVEQLPTDPIGSKLQQATMQVGRALATRNIVKARAAVAAFRFELVGLKQAERWRDKAYKLTEKIDSCLDWIVTAREKAFVTLIEQERWSDANQLIAQLEQLDRTAQHGGLLEELKNRLQRARDGDQTVAAAGLIPENFGERKPKE